MNKKISLGIVIGFCLIAVFASAAVTYKVITDRYDEMLTQMPEKLQRYESFDEVADIVKNNYYGTADVDMLSSALIMGYIDSLGDENSRYLTQKQYERYKSEVEGNMTGIGVRYSPTEKYKIKLTYVDEASPAYLAGMKKGDIIVAFDGIEVNKENYDEMTSKLEDTLTSGVNIIYKRGSSEHSVSLKKGYEALSVKTGVYDSIGYIQLREFFSGTAEAVSQAVDTFMLSGIAAIVIDLRGNSSANYDNAVSTLDIFVPMTQNDKPAATVRDEKGDIIKTYLTTPGEINLPVLLLTDSSTASAAELFACAMRDFSKGKIVSCENTAGKVSLQQIFELSRGGAILLSTGKVFSYNSQSYENEGLQADFKTKKSAASDDFTKDKMFLYAASVIRQEVTDNGN